MAKAKVTKVKTKPKVKPQGQFEAYMSMLQGVRDRHGAEAARAISQAIITLAKLRKKNPKAYRKVVRKATWEAAA